MRLISLIVAFAFAACTPFPVLEGTIDDTARAAPYPQLTPLADVLAQADAPVGDDPAMAARIAALQQRASQLRRIDIAALQ